MDWRLQLHRGANSLRGFLTEAYLHALETIHRLAADEGGNDCKRPPSLPQPLVPQFLGPAV